MSGFVFLTFVKFRAPQIVVCFESLVIIIVSSSANIVLIPSLAFWLLDKQRERKKESVLCLLASFHPNPPPSLFFLYKII